MKRRDVPTLALTIKESAEAIRLSEATLRDWVREGIVRTVRWHTITLIPRVELDRIITVALDNDGVLPGTAAADSSRGSAAAVEESATGASGPRDDRGVLGEVPAATVGLSDLRSPGRSTHSPRRI